MKIKEGNIVGRKSYNKDVFFIVDKIIIASNSRKIAILRGVNIRIIADSPIEDLEVVSKEEILNISKNLELEFEKRINLNKKIREKLTRQKIYTGKILHLDGDRKYTEKSIKYYTKIGLNAVVKNVVEYKQKDVVIPLLNKYNPDILIITGHDAMLKKRYKLQQYI